EPFQGRPRAPRRLREDSVSGVIPKAGALPACCSFGIFDVGDRTIPAGRGLGVPVAFLVLVFDCLRVTGDALFGRGRARRRKRRLVGGKRLRENAVDRVGPAVVVTDDPIYDMRHGCTRWWQASN